MTERICSTTPPSVTFAGKIPEGRAQRMKSQLQDASLHSGLLSQLARLLLSPLCTRIEPANLSCIATTSQR